MGKNHRHTKKLKSEKNKIHIKTKTKFLPKGQNVTSTTFKIKPIILQEQLKERESTTNLASKKNVNIDELITKLKHFNDTVKADSCQELKDLIAVNPIESIQVYLAPIFQNTSILIQDKERKVRRAAVKLFYIIFEKSDSATLRLFFNYILTNLKCAMTNINKYIQEDSLLLLDVILETKSVLIAEHFNDFFPNFLMLISKIKNQTNSERSLSLNLEGKITSVKWRVKVLTRLYGVLYTLITNKQNTPEVNPVMVESQGCVYIPIYNTITEGNPDFIQDQNDQNLDSHILTLLKLLYEIWMEIVPEKSTKKIVTGPTILPTDESVAIFTCVVNILRLLQEYVENTGNDSIFSDSKATLFLDSLITNFPYTHNKKTLEIAKDFPKCFLLNHDQNCIQDNLTIIYIFITLRAKTSRNYPKQNAIITYLTSCLNTQKRINSNSFRFLWKILQEILVKNTFLCRKIGATETEVLESTANYCGNVKIPEKFRIEILQVLINSRLQTEQAWMEKLPDFLCQKQVPAKLIDGILDLCRKGHKTVQEAVVNCLDQILENLVNLEINDSLNLETSLRNFASIFFYLPNLSSQDLQKVQNFILAHPDLEISKNLGNILKLKNYAMI